MSSTPGAEAPLKYTKESFLGVRDAWMSFAAAQMSKAAALLEQFADKLPPAVKSKIPVGKASQPKPTDTTGANAPS
jgi:hypothetical protein